MLIQSLNRDNVHAAGSGISFTNICAIRDAAIRVTSDRGCSQQSEPGTTATVSPQNITPDVVIDSP
jgi:hypothetical protein